VSNIEIFDMRSDDEYFVSTCTHIFESEEIDGAADRRLSWINDMKDDGMVVKVATIDSHHAGFLYMMPVEICPWGPLGKDLMTFPCLYVKDEFQGEGVGEALIAEAEAETKRQKRKGLVTIGYYNDFWFMPGTFFEKIGFEVARKKGKYAILWKVYDKSVDPPRFFNRNYEYQPIEGKVVIDLFYHSFCLTANTEFQRVREIADEYGDKIVLNEYNADNREILLKYQIPRAIFINGEEIGWGYEAPKDGLREAIEKVIEK
jgi:GNAT superfamily N-acetyltransferase